MIWSKVKWAVIGALVPASASGQAPPSPLVGAARPAPSPGANDDKGQEVAADPEATPPAVRSQPEMRPHAGCGVPGGFHFYGGSRLTASRVFTRNAAAGYGGEADIEVIYTSRHHAGQLFGIRFGIEGWGSKDGGGGGLPMSMYFGASSPRFFFSVGGGWEWLIIDSVKDNTTLGVFAPQATGTVGFWIDRVRFMADARAVYRWHVNGDHRSQTSLGFSLGLPLLGPHPPAPSPASGEGETEEKLTNFLPFSSPSPRSWRGGWGVRPFPWARCQKAVFL